MSSVQMVQLRAKLTFRSTEPLPKIFGITASM